MTGTEESKMIAKVQRKLRRETSTNEGMARFLNDTVGRDNWVFDTFEKVWITADPQHDGAGLSYYVIRKNGSWFKACIPPCRIS